MLTASDFQDAAEFEANVAAKLTRLDAEDIPCANSMMMFCPRPPFRGAQLWAVVPAAHGKVGSRRGDGEAC